jgi:basic amino acid/polyamine antiporter, APA family
MTGGQFHRAMGLVDATAIVIGSMIGSGIFIVAAQTSRDVGCTGWFLASWIFAGFLTVTAATCYAELASMYPEAGGQYIFLREAYGKLTGFLYGWTLFMVIQSGTNAAVAVAFAKFLGVFVPLVSDENVLFQIKDWHFSTQKLVALLVIILLTAINCGGIHLAKLIQTSFTSIKVVALFSLIVLGIFATQAHHGIGVNFTNIWDAKTVDGAVLSGFPLLLAFSVGLVGPLFAMDAWNNVTFSGGEVKDPTKTLPRSLVTGTILVCVLYTLTNVIYLLLLPLSGMKDASDVITRGIQYAAQDRVGTASLEVIFGEVGQRIMAGAIMISVFGALNGLILSGPRLYYAMAKDGLFFKQAGMLNVKTNVPVFGLLLQGVWSCVLATSGKYGDLLDMVVFAALLFYILTVAAVIILRKKVKDRERPFKVPLYPVLNWLYIIAASVVAVAQIVARPEYSGAGFLIIVLGLPVFFLWQRNAANAGSSLN